MEEVLRRHAAEFDEAYHLLHSVDLIKNGETYRVEIHQKMGSGYRKQFFARHFKKTKILRAETLRPGAAEPGGIAELGGSTYWVALESLTPMADTARDALNQALIWLAVQTKKGAI